MPIFGIDVSTSTVDWTKVKAAGISFGIVKATEGNGLVMPRLGVNLAGMRAAGMVPGAYHFLVSGSYVSGAAQCDYFLSKVGNIDDLIVALDVEVEGNLTTQPNIGDVRSFADRFKALHPNHPLLVYSGAWYWKSGHYMGNPPGSDIGPLWDSSYVAGNGSPQSLYPTVPSSYWVPGYGAGYGGWTRTTVLQFSSSGYVSGSTSAVDLSAFLGTADEMRRLLIDPSLPTTATEEPMTYAEIHLNVNNQRALHFAAGKTVKILAGLRPGDASTDFTPAQGATYGSDALANVSQDPAGYPSGWFARISAANSGFDQHWVKLSDVTVDPDSPIDCSAPIASATASLQAQITGLKTQLNDVNAQIGALNQQVTALKADIAKKDAYVAAFPKG